MKKKIVLTAAIACTSIIVLFSIFYISEDGWSFRDSIELKFQRTSGDNFLVSDVTNFEWDIVCYIPQYPDSYLYDQTNRKLDEEKRLVLKRNFSFLYYWPSFQGAFLFFKKSALVKKFEYFSLALRHSDGAWARPLHHMVINNQKYVFLSENMMVDWPCFRYEEARFIRFFYEKWGQGTIKIGRDYKKS